MASRDESHLVYAVGDAATGNSDSLKLANLVAAAKPDAFLWLGDVYESGTAAEFAANYKPSWGQLDDVVYPCPGNHDFPNFLNGYAPYFGLAKRPNVPYHVVDLGNWSIFMLNSEQAMDIGSSQYEWARETLYRAAKPGLHNIACWHRPRYCSGSHGDAIDTDALWQIFAPRCPVILSGHAHNVQVFKPDPTGCRQVISGAGGRGLYAEIAGDPRLEWGEASGYAVVELILRETDCMLSVVDESGVVMWQELVAV